MQGKLSLAQKSKGLRELHNNLSSYVLYNVAAADLALTPRKIPSAEKCECE